MLAWPTTTFMASHPPSVIYLSISYHPNVPSGSAFITLPPRSQQYPNRKTEASRGECIDSKPSSNGRRLAPGPPGRRRARPPPRRRAGRAASHPHGIEGISDPGRRRRARGPRATRARRLHACLLMLRSPPGASTCAAPAQADAAARVGVGQHQKKSSLCRSGSALPHVQAS